MQLDVLWIFEHTAAREELQQASTSGKIVCMFMCKGRVLKPVQGTSFGSSVPLPAPASGIPYGAELYSMLLKDTASFVLDKTDLPSMGHQVFELLTLSLFYVAQLFINRQPSQHGLMTMWGFINEVALWTWVLTQQCWYSQLSINCVGQLALVGCTDYLLSCITPCWSHPFIYQQLWHCHYFTWCQVYFSAVCCLEPFINHTGAGKTQKCFIVSWKSTGINALLRNTTACRS